ncbi:MAG TPA: CPBP family intramembrane glutamic endopeptidase [Nitrospira sp.]|nr:CPBP family intramembrane glutamic endopeptidase [Nitrospira sp.]
MDTPAETIGTQAENHSWWRATDAPQPVGLYADHFSPVVSVLAAIFLIASLASVVWLSASIPKLERMESPEQALSRMVGRTMDAQIGLARSPTWKREVVGWIAGDEATEEAQALEWYAELAESSEDTVVHLQLAVLQAETGHRQDALLSAKHWSDQDEPFPRFAGLIHAAYDETIPADPDTLNLLQADVAELLPSGWFYERLAGRLAKRAHNDALLMTIERQADARADRIFNASWKLTVVELGAMVVGTAVLIQVWRKRNSTAHLLRLHPVGVPPPWPGGVGAAVLLRGGAIGAIVTAVLLLYLPPENSSLRALAIPMTNVPLLLLAYHHLFRPSGMTFGEGFGLDVPWSAVGRLAAAVVAVVAAGLWGEWAMDRLSAYWHWTSHWTEWFDSDLVWGSRGQMLISLIEYVVFAPVFEELAFRGLLFAILRRKFRFLPAALISASIFGIAHGYGVVGLVSVCWSGVLWAWIYEKTGSLLPGMFAHSINNLLVCLAVMALLR